MPKIKYNPSLHEVFLNALCSMTFLFGQSIVNKIDTDAGIKWTNADAFFDLMNPNN
jgi:hypothetical protein